ncbi:Uroporphyrinogen decarboxylase in heme biosynthesis [Gamsiella multidivaricata]|nr:Uroporphyrinogen decarboxylase in heme biosynthesis [Gamsiella multidivaricata]
MLQVFESWAGELSPQDFEQFSLPYLKQIAQRVKSELDINDAAVPMTVFAKGAWYAIESLSDIGYDTISLDWTVSPSYARTVTKGRVTLDPGVLLGGEEAIERETERMVREFGSSRRYIANLGHGIMQQVPVEAMEVFLKTVHRVGREIAAKEEEA